MRQPCCYFHFLKFQMAPVCLAITEIIIIIIKEVSWHIVSISGKMPSSIGSVFKYWMLILLRSINKVPAKHWGLYNQLVSTSSPPPRNFKPCTSCRMTSIKGPFLSNQKTDFLDFSTRTFKAPPHSKFQLFNVFIVVYKVYTP